MIRTSHCPLIYLGAYSHHFVHGRCRTVLAGNWTRQQIATVGRGRVLRHLELAVATIITLFVMQQIYRAGMARSERRYAMTS